MNDKTTLNGIVKRCLRAARLSKHIEDQLSALRRDYTIVLVTHTLRQARRLADYALFVYFGNLIEHGSADHLFNSPVDPRTRAYIEGVFS